MGVQMLNSQWKKMVNENREVLKEMIESVMFNAISSIAESLPLSKIVV